jgi:hypothetical protein
MKAYDVITQLRSTLPKYTNYFSDEYDISSLTRSGTTVTAITSTPHNLVTGYYVQIVNALTPFTLDELTRTGNVATGITLNAHDLTEQWPIDNPTVELIGADQAEYNGTHDLLTVPNRKTFTFKVTGTPTTPATGTIKLLSNLAVGYNGWQQVTVIDSTTFTYQTASTPESPALGSNIVARSRARISGAVSVERAIESYTKKSPDEMWGFVVAGNTIANKNRAIYSDATDKYGKGEDYRQELIAPFAIYVFVPATNSISGRRERDQMENLLPALCNSLLKVKFPTGFIENPYSGVVFSSHSFYDYVGSYYIHEFMFETTAWIIEGDTIEPDYNVAFRDIFVNYGSSFDSSDDIIMTDHIDLDDEPLG